MAVGDTPPTGEGSPEGRAGAALERDRVLESAPGLAVRIHSGSNVELLLEGRPIDGGRHALAVLDAFVHPSSVAAALDRLETRVKGAQDWMELTATIVRLVRAGALRNGTEAEPLVGEDPFTFDSAPKHAAMLDDRVRTDRYRDAIRRVVRPGDVVVEVGTGTGVLAIAAARAGASRVYAVEAGAIGKLAREMFAANSLGDRITLIEGWSTEVELPEPADVLLAEIIGNDPLGEGVLEFTADAVRRWLGPGARLIPRRLRLFGLPVEVPRERLSRRTFTAETLDAWGSWYDIDFGPLREAARRSPHFFYIRPQLAHDWPVLGDPILFADIDLKEIRRFTVSGRHPFTATDAGRLSGMLVYFELELGGGVRLSTHPAEADDHNCWSSPVWVFPDAPDVRPGQGLWATYSYRVPGRRNGVQISTDAQPTDRGGAADA